MPPTPPRDDADASRGAAQQRAPDDEREGEPGVELGAEDGDVRHCLAHLLGKHQLLQDIHHTAA